MFVYPRIHLEFSFFFFQTKRVINRRVRERIKGWGRITAEKKCSNNASRFTLVALGLSWFLSLYAFASLNKVTARRFFLSFCHFRKQLALSAGGT